MVRMTIIYVNRETKTLRVSLLGTVGCPDLDFQDTVIVLLFLLTED